MELIALRLAALRVGVWWFFVHQKAYSAPLPMGSENDEYVENTFVSLWFFTSFCDTLVSLAVTFKNIVASSQKIPGIFFCSSVSSDFCARLDSNWLQNLWRIRSYTFVLLFGVMWIFNDTQFDNSFICGSRRIVLVAIDSLAESTREL